MRLLPVACLPLAVVTAGCLQGQRLIKVNADGSGTIVDTITLGEQARGMIDALSGMDESSPAEKKAKTDAKLQARAAAMGPGVKLVSYDSVKDGPEKIVYAFSDVRKIKIDATPDPADNDAKSEGKETLHFRLDKKGGRSLLTIVGAGPKPDAKPKPAAGEKSEEAAEAAAKMQAGAMAMMKTMLKGLRMTTQVEVGGRLVRTSSPWVEGSRVTLMDIDFDALLADEASWKKLQALGDPQQLDPSELKGLKGIKVQTTPETTIEFE
jgi:hypothetical protein